MKIWNLMRMKGAIGQGAILYHVRSGGAAGATDYLLDEFI